MGYKVRDAIREELMNKIVTIHTFGFDKYGRLLHRPKRKMRQNIIKK